MKKYKRLLIVFLSLLIVFSLGCAGNVEAVSSVDDPQPVIIETPTPEPEPEPVSEVISEPEPEPEPEVDPNEELTWQFLEVDEEWYKTYEGMGLKRDGKLYSLSDGVPTENWEKTGLCVRHGNGGTPGGVGDKSKDHIISDDRFVIPCVSGEDDLAWYGKPVTTLTLIPMSFYGYTIPVLKGGSDLYIGKKSYDSYDELTCIENYENTSVQLIDHDGNDVLNNMRDLTQGSTYTLKWVDGEEKLEANWMYYESDESGAITLTGEATDDPQITKYDFSTLPSGLYYMVESYAMVEVKND